MGYALTRNVIDVVLALLHPIHVLLQTDGFITRLGCLVPQELSNLCSVGGVLVDAKLQAFAELLVEFLVVVLLLCDLRKHLEAFLHQVFLDHPENLVLLERLARDVRRQILRVHHALHKVEPLRHELIAIVHDKHTANVEFDVISLLLGLEQVERSTARHEDQCAELQLSLHAEVFYGQVVLPIVRKGFVEGRVLFVRYVLRLPHPEWLVLVQLLPLVGHLLHLLGLFLLFLLLLLLVHLLDLWLVAILPLVLLLFLLILGVRNLFLLGLLNVQLDGKANELGVFFHQILQPPLLQELRLVLLEVTDDLGAALDLTVHHLSVLLPRERATCRGLPNVLLIIVVLAHHANLVRDQVTRVKPNPELADHGDVATRGHGLHEGFGARLRDGAQIVDQLVLGHADARIFDCEGGVSLVGDNLDVEVRLSLDLLRVRDRLVADLVERVRRVGNQLAQEDLLVGVEGVDDEAHQLLDVSIEREGLRHGGLQLRTGKVSTGGGTGNKQSRWTKLSNLNKG